MVQERRRFMWQETKPPMYDYIQKRLEERRKEQKFRILQTEDELKEVARSHYDEKVRDMKVEKL